MTNAKAIELARSATKNTATYVAVEQSTPSVVEIGMEHYRVSETADAYCVSMVSGEASWTIRK